MIRVDRKDEPLDFDVSVRQKGLAFFQTKGINPKLPLTPGTKLPIYWRECLDDLYHSYQGICAYLCVYFRKVTGGATVDHFIPKSIRPDLAYEWVNYRLACSRMNSRKKNYLDVLDPFEVENGWFCLELVSGRIYPNPHLPDDIKSRVEATINRLKLDDPGNRELRASIFQEYCEIHHSPDYFNRQSPFVCFEADRQGLL